MLDPVCTTGSHKRKQVHDQISIPSAKAAVLLLHAAHDCFVICFRGPAIYFGKFCGTSGRAVAAYLRARDSHQVECERCAAMPVKQLGWSKRRVAPV
jgi:hypothetical protein